MDHQAGQNSPTQQPPIENAWGLLALLTVINIFNFVDRQLLSSFANFIKPELGLTDTQYGLLTGLFFILFYAVAGLFMGALADLTHRPRLIAGAIMVWSLLTAASGAAKSFIGMAIPRALIGVGESALTPSALSLIADRFQHDKLGLAAGIYYMGVPVGAGASLIIAGALGPMIGWRNCFYLLGALGVIMALVMLLVRETRPPRPAHMARPGLLSQFGALTQTLKSSPSLIATIIGGVSVHLAVGAGQFDQLWFVLERGYDKSEIAILTGVVTVFGGIAGNVFGGFAGDWWQKKTGSGPQMLLFWLLLLLMPLNIAYRIVPADSPLLLAGVFGGIFLLSAYYGPSMSAVQQLCPVPVRATVTAFYILCVNALGLVVGITGTGIMVDWLRSAGVVDPYSKALLAFTLVSGAAIPAFWCAGRWFVRDKAKVAG